MCGFVAVFHGGAAAEFDFAAFIDADNFDVDHVADFDDVFGAFDAEVGELTDVAHAVFAWQDFDECAEFFDVHHGAVVGLADGEFLRHAFDDLLGAGHAVGVVRVDADAAVVVDVDVASGLGNDGFDVLSAGADDEADFVGVDFDGLNARGVRRHFGARGCDDGIHHVEHAHPEFAGLAHGFEEDGVRDAGQFEVELETGDAFAGAAQFEVHIAEVIFAAEDVGEGGVTLEHVAFELGDESDADAGDGCFNRHACIHEREPWSTGRPIDSQDLPTQRGSFANHLIDSLRQRSRIVIGGTHDNSRVVSASGFVEA